MTVEVEIRGDKYMFVAAITTWVAGCGLGAINSPWLGRTQVSIQPIPDEVLEEFVAKHFATAVYALATRADCRTPFPGVWAMVDADYSSSRLHRFIRRGLAGPVYEMPWIANAAHPHTAVRPYFWVPSQHAKLDLETFAGTGNATAVRLLRAANAIDSKVKT